MKEEKVQQNHLYTPKAKGSFNTALSYIGYPVLVKAFVQQRKDAKKEEWLIMRWKKLKEDMRR